MRFDTYTERRGRGRVCIYIDPVEFLTPWITVESVVDAWNGGTPHQYYDTEVVELVAESLNCGTVDVDGVVSECYLIRNG